MTSPAERPTVAELRRDLISAVQAWVFRSDEPISSVVCIRGHDRAEHSYVNRQGNQVCRACNKIAMRRARQAVKEERS